MSASISATTYFMESVQLHRRFLVIFVRTSRSASHNNMSPIRYESYLQHSDPVVLALNPFFVLEYAPMFTDFLTELTNYWSLIRNDPTPSRGTQLPRAASLIVSSLGFIHDLRKGMLGPDTVKNIPLDMDQYSRLFGTARIPTQV